MKKPTTNTHTIEELTEDGAMGYIKDVTNEDWYKNPNITLYDELEQSTYELICEYAELIGVHLVKEEPDFALTNEIRDNIISMLETTFGIEFPKNKETT